MTRRVLVVGDLVDDIVVAPLTDVTHGSDTTATIRRVPGGSAANVAAWLGWHGSPVTFVGRAGRANADWHARELERLGVRPFVALDPEVPTGTIVLLLDQQAERTMYVDRGANARLAWTDVPVAAWDDVGWLHLTGYSFFDPAVRPVALRLLAEARDRGAPVSVDPSSCAFLEEVTPQAFLSWSAGVDVVVANIDEASAMTGLSESSEMAESLSDRYGTAVVKLGSAGALARTAGGVLRHTGALHADAVDTTGAGDAFAAGFLSRWVVATDLSAALAAGARAAAGAVSIIGARPPTR
jgi:sugar/nucleoside kinase (ribokinase family)